MSLTVAICLQREGGREGGRVFKIIMSSSSGDDTAKGGVEYKGESGGAGVEDYCYLLSCEGGREEERGKSSLQGLWQWEGDVIIFMCQGGVDREDREEYIQSVLGSRGR